MNIVYIRIAIFCIRNCWCDQSAKKSNWRASCARWGEREIIMQKKREKREWTKKIQQINRSNRKSIEENSKRKKRRRKKHTLNEKKWNENRFKLNLWAKDEKKNASERASARAPIKLWIQRNGLNGGQRIKILCVVCDKENANINHSFKMHRTALVAIYAYYFLPFI